MSKSSEDTSSSPGRYATVGSKGTGAHGAEALAECDPALLQAALVAVLQAGDAVLMGTTRDGGAVAMQMYSGTSIDKLYGASVEELETLLRGLVEASADT